MTGRAEFLYKNFIGHFKNAPTPCQDAFFRDAADFVTCDDADILVVNGYAGTGKTSAVSAVVAALRDVGTPSVLLAPTGRAAKVLSRMSGRAASTVHKHIYRQKGVGSNGMGEFNLAPNKARSTLFVVDEVSLIGIDSSAQQNNTLFGTGNLLEDLINFVRSGDDCRLILIGDGAQLPPVGLDASPALSPDYMDGFGGVRYSRLVSVVRQAGESGILVNATALRKSICLMEGIDDSGLEGGAGSGGGSGAGSGGGFGGDGAGGGSGVAGFGGDGAGGLKLRLDGFDDICRVSGGELIETITDAYSRYGEDETVILCRSNKMANRYNMGIRSMVQFKEENLVRGDKLMIVKNCYQFVDDLDMDYIANGDIAVLERISRFEERYGLHFAEARLSFPDYDNQEITAKVCLDTLSSETASLSHEQQTELYNGVSADYAHLKTKKKIWDAVREDHYYNALQLKYAEAITCHKSQGGQWDCVFIDCPFWQDEQTLDDFKWLYTALTRAVKKVYLVNFKDRFFE